MMALAPATDEQVRALAREILARNAYARWRPQRAGWVLDLVQRLQRWLHQWADWMRDLSVTRPVLYTVIVGGLVVISLLLLAHLVYALRVALATRNGAGSSATPEVPAPDFREEAAALARAGHFLDAAHRMQLAVIDVLLRRRVLELQRSEPNRTLRHRLRTAALPAAERAELLALLDRLERQWFRDRTDDRELYTAWCRVHGRLQAVPEAA